MATDRTARGMAAKALAGGGGGGIASAPLTGTGATVASSTPLMDLSQTWNGAGVTFGALNLNITDTASSAGSKLLDLKVGGSSKFSVDKAGNVSIPSDAAMIIGPDVKLYRDNPNELALRNGTNPMAFGVFNTFTDMSNYEVGYLSWVSNQFIVGQAQGGTGVQRNMVVQGASSIFFRTNDRATSDWQMATDRTFRSATDGQSSIGTPSAGRPLDIYVTRVVRTGATTVASLPSAATVTAGARMLVTDANAPTFAAVVAGGGSTVVPVYSDGAVWRVG